MKTSIDAKLKRQTWPKKQPLYGPLSGKKHGNPVSDHTKEQIIHMRQWSQIGDVGSAFYKNPSKSKSTSLFCKPKTEDLVLEAQINFPY